MRKNLIPFDEQEDVLNFSPDKIDGLVRIWPQLSSPAYYCVTVLYPEYCYLVLRHTPGKALSNFCHIEDLVGNWDTLSPTDLPDMYPIRLTLNEDCWKFLSCLTGQVMGIRH